MDIVSDAAQYGLPEGKLGLKGPMVRPKLGTLPLRGDLAHIALADRFLVPHYVVPQFYTVCAEDVALKLEANGDSETLAMLPSGSTFEALDFAGDWCWGCLGAEGPSGYVPKNSVTPKPA